MITDEIQRMEDPPEPTEAQWDEIRRRAEDLSEHQRRRHQQHVRLVGSDDGERIEP